MQSSPSSDQERHPGARMTPRGASFSIRCPHADSVSLMLFDQPDAAHPREEHPLARLANTGIWQVETPGVRAGQLYGYRVKGGPAESEAWILDPCARAVTFAGRAWGQRKGWPSGHAPGPGAHFPKAALIDDTAFNWGADAPPNTAWSDTVIYEVHVRGFTRGTGAGVRFPGTYEGLVERIPYLLDLGITAVELMPVHEFDELEFHLAGGPRQRLINYWGYSPLSFSAPMARYAADPDPATAVNAFKQLVKALHAAGMEVILDVVFNHTGEGGRDGPAYHFKRLDPTATYVFHEDGKTYRDVTGCGNTVNANHPATIDLVIDSLCTWVEAMHVDGFRFDLATALTRDAHGIVMEDPPLLERIRKEPRLRGVKFIAEPWDAAGHHHGGRFPAPDWAEWNDRFRDDVRQFWNGAPGMLGAFATRLSGSADLFEPPGRSPLQSLNFVACHDGFPLGDLVRYAQKHNEDNVEDNRDGAHVNYSVNYGVEGHTDDPEILRLREQHMKNLLATLFISQGVPMLTAGDEFARTQGGNNNAYAQDNERSWLDWRHLDRYASLHAFAKRMIDFRRTHACLRRDRFLIGVHEGADPPYDIEWFGPENQAPDWHGGHAVACRIAGRDASDPDLFLAFNAGEHPALFHLQDNRGGWRCEWSTHTENPAGPEPGHPLVVPPFSASALSTPGTRAS